MDFDFLMLNVVLVAYGLFGIYQTMKRVNSCECGDEIPEGGGMASQQMLCECGEYYHRMIIRREDELKRIKEEKRKGNDYDTVL